MALSKETSASTISYHLLVVRLRLKVPSQPIRSPRLCPAASLRWLLGLRPLSLRKRLAGVLDGTAQPVVTSVPIHLTGGSWRYSLRTAGFCLLLLEIRLPVVFMTIIFVFRISSKNIGSARTSAVDNSTNLSSLRLQIRQ